jgi:hypothetical protein
LEYRTNELTMTLPGTGWEDTSRHSLELPAPDGTHISLEIVRADAIPPEALPGCVDADLRGHARHQRGYELLLREAFESTAFRGVRVSFRTLAPEGALQHEVAYVPLPEVLLVFVVHGAVQHAEACGQLLREAITSIRLR